MICSWQTFLAEVLPALTVIVGLLAYKYCTYHYKHWKTLGVPHTKPLPLLGHFADPILGRHSSTTVVHSFYRHFEGHRYFGIYQLRHPLFVVRDPELVHAVLTKDFGSFHDRLMDRKSFEHDRLFNNLVNLKGDKWKAVRAKLSPTFTVAKLKAMFNDLRVCADQLADKLSQLTSDDQGIYLLIVKI